MARGPAASGWACLLASAALALTVASAPAATSSAQPWQRVLTINGQISSRAPVLGPEDRGGPASAEPAPAGGSPRADWVLQYTHANAVFQDVDFADPSNGFTAGELGIVYRTTDGGAHWQQVMGLGYPYYWYGVEALSSQDLVVSGFQNQTGEGIVRWSHDGGLTWGPILPVDPSAWLDRIRFGDANHGVASTIGGGQIVVTTSGGQAAGDWSRVTADPSGGWFAGGFTFLPTLQVCLTGVKFCRSFDGGLSWQALPSADPVFDGGAEFVNQELGFTGGGSISPNVQGWIHRTTDGGNSWSPRLITTPFPVRSLRFASAARGWAAGGNIYSSVGGIYGTTDGGSTWILESDTGAEMRGLSFARVSADSVDVWACGYTAAFQGRIYKRRVWLPEDPASVQGTGRGGQLMVRSFPNPFNPATSLSLSIARPESVAVDIFDPAGRIIRRLQPGLLGVGTHQIRWDGRDSNGARLPSGIFFYRLMAGKDTFGGTLVLVR